MKCPECDAEAHPSYRAHWFAPVVHTPVVVHEVANAVVHKAVLKSGEGRYSDSEARKAYRREWMKRKRAEWVGWAKEASGDERDAKRQALGMGRK